MHVDRNTGYTKLETALQINPISVCKAHGRSRWPCGLRRRSTTARSLGSRLQNLLRWMFVRLMCLLCAVYVEVSATGWSLIRRSPSDCVWTVSRPVPSRAAASLKDKLKPRGFVWLNLEYRKFRARWIQATGHWLCDASMWPCELKNTLICDTVPMCYTRNSTKPHGLRKKKKKPLGLHNCVIPHKHTRSNRQKSNYIYCDNDIRIPLCCWHIYSTISVWTIVRPEYSTWRFSFTILPYYSTALITSKNFHILSSFNVNEMGSYWVLFYCTLIVVLSWPEDGRLRPKHVAKYHLIVIIASCLDVGCVLTVYNTLYKFDIHNGMASLKPFWVAKTWPGSLTTPSRLRQQFVNFPVASKRGLCTHFHRGYNKNAAQTHVCKVRPVLHILQWNIRMIFLRYYGQLASQHSEWTSKQNVPLATVQWRQRLM